MHADVRYNFKSYLTQNNIQPNPDTRQLSYFVLDTFVTHWLTSDTPIEHENISSIKVLYMSQWYPKNAPKILPRLALRNQNREMQESDNINQAHTPTKKISSARNVLISTQSTITSLTKDSLQ